MSVRRPCGPTSPNSPTYHVPAVPWREGPLKRTLGWGSVRVATGSITRWWTLAGHGSCSMACPHGKRLGVVLGVPCPCRGTPSKEQRRGPGGGDSSGLDANYSNRWPEAPLGEGGGVGALGPAESPPLGPRHAVWSRLDVEKAQGSSVSGRRCVRIAGVVDHC